MSTATENTQAQIGPPGPTNAIPFQDALNGLLALSQLLGSLRPPEGGQRGASPVIILSVNGVELRAGDAVPAAPNATQAEPQNSSVVSPVVSSPNTNVQQEWFHKIEEGLASLQKATAALNTAFGESVRNIDQTLASHAAAIDSVRTTLTQNEQLMERMVELLPSDFGEPQPEAFAPLA